MVLKFIQPVVCYINSSVKHTSCMKVSFWVSSRQARVGVSETGPTLDRLKLTQKLIFIQTESHDGTKQANICFGSSLLQGVEYQFNH